MKLKNILIVVSNLEQSREFYQNLFGLHVIKNSGDTMILTEGLVLQKRDVWEQYLGCGVTGENNSCELYFEERDVEGFAARLAEQYPSIRYVSPLAEHGNGQKFLRFYDPDGNLIEVGTPV